MSQSLGWSGTLLPKLKDSNDTAEVGKAFIDILSKLNQLSSNFDFRVLGEPTTLPEIVGTLPNSTIIGNLTVVGSIIGGSGSASSNLGSWLRTGAGVDGTADVVLRTDGSNTYFFPYGVPVGSLYFPGAGTVFPGPVLFNEGIAIPTGQYYAGGAKEAAAAGVLSTPTQATVFSAIAPFLKNVGDVIVISASFSEQSTTYALRFSSLNYVQLAAANQLTFYGTFWNFTGSSTYANNNFSIGTISFVANEGSGSLFSSQGSPSGSYLTYSL